MLAHPISSAYLLPMLPPLSSLRAFEAVARHGGVGRAASDLGVSQPAVSQQLRRLEAALGVRLIRAAGARSS